MELSSLLLSSNELTKIFMDGGKMSPKSWVFIINPMAGNGLAGSYTDIVEEMIKKYRVDAELVLTERRGHATEIASEYIQKGFDHIIGVGGDGTFSEIVQALVDKDNVTFGAISAGTGNDFFRFWASLRISPKKTGRVFFLKRIPFRWMSANATIVISSMAWDWDMMRRWLLKIMRLKIAVKSKKAENQSIGNIF